MHLTLHQILKATGGRPLAGAVRSVCRRISTDTRTVKDGEWFLAIRGEKFDGHDHLMQARERGAKGFIVSRVPEGFKPPPRGAMIQVEDTLTAFGQIASAWRMSLPVQVMAVTGSSGKTTTKDLLGRIMRRQAKTLMTRGNLNNRIGVPHQLQRLSAEHVWAVLEIGMNLPGEIATLTEMVSPRIGVITNVGTAHAGMFRSGVKGVFEAKAELIANMEPGGIVILNADDGDKTTELARRAARRGLEVRRFSARGRGAKADVRVEHVRPAGGQGHIVTLEASGDRVEILLRAFGEHNAANVAAAAAAALATGVPLDAIPAAVRGFRPTGFRSTVRMIRGVRFVVDCYNANPQSMGAALESLAAMQCRGGRVAVLGDMFELGRASEAEHRRIGAAVKRAGVDLLVTFGQEARLIADGARGVPTRHFTDPKACARHLAKTLRRGDVALIKGSRGMAMERIIAALEESDL